MVATGVIMTIKVIAKRLSRQAQAVSSTSKAGPRLSASGLSAGNTRGHSIIYYLTRISVRGKMRKALYD